MLSQSPSRHLLSALGTLGICLALASAGLARQSPPVLPDPALTPGVALPVTKADICRAGYTKLVRNVPAAVKRQVYKNYGIRSHRPGEYEVDHLISLELGGSNSLKNLWPESYETQPWNAHVKDKLENELHREICSDRVEMAAAQQCIAKDWIACYKRTFHTQMPLSGKSGKSAKRRGRKAGGSGGRATGSATSKEPKDSGSGRSGQEGPGTNESRVWVNTKSGKYFLPGSRYYGKTKEGTYMTEAEARAGGYVKAK